jgi:hypothetical protein
VEEASVMACPLVGAQAEKCDLTMGMAQQVGQAKGDGRLAAASPAYYQ